MRYTQLFARPKKSTKEYDSVNATYLIKGGFIDQTMSGVYTYLPLGNKVLAKIENIIREEMNKVANEILMPTLAPTENWEKTGRIDTYDTLFKASGATKESQALNSGTYILSPTHEEIVTPLAKQFKFSYKELPFAVYQIQTKFRNEARPKSGLLRGREFRMKDLYSFHTSEEDLLRFYAEIKKVYTTIYERLGMGNVTVIALASGGDFTEQFSHEFQTKCATGEDTIYYIKSEDVYYNKEVAPDVSNLSEDEYEMFPASEVGNIFPLNTKYSDAFGYTYTDEKGTENPVYMGCYGIGSSRVMGAIVETFHDEKGILWPEPVAPFKVHLVGLNLEDETVVANAQNVYEKLQNAEIEVLFDDRADTGVGEKFAEADLIGIPHRIVVSRKTGNQVEYKRRSETESSLIDLETFINSSTL